MTSESNQTQNDNYSNNTNSNTNISNNSSNLKAESPTFDVLQLSEEQLFFQLQNINIQIQNVKYEAEQIIFPSLTQINSYLLMYQANAHLLALPQNHSQFLQLQQQQIVLQQQYVQNQTLHQQLLQQLEQTQQLYHKIKNESYVAPNEIIPDDDKQNIINETETISPPSPSTSNVHIPLQSPSPSPSPSVSQPQSIVSQLIEPEEIKKDSQEKPICCHASNDKNISQYDVKTLIQLQPQYLSINWTQYTDIPRSIRLISHGIDNEKYMENVVAMFARKAEKPWLGSNGPQTIDKQENLKKRLRGVLNRMTPEKFDKVAAQTMNVMNQFAETKHQMKIIIASILQFAVTIPVFGNQYAQLCRHLYAHLPKLGMICDYKWILDDHDISKTFREMMIRQTNELFTKHRNYSPDDIDLDADGEKITDRQELEIKIIKLKRNFYAVMTLVAELYNVELISNQVIYKGLFDILLPPKNTALTSIDIEGLCRVLKRCGKKLEAQRSGKKCVDRYLQKLLSQAKKFDFRTKVLVDEVKEMRANHWEHRIKKVGPAPIHEIREKFQADNVRSNGNKHRGRKHHKNYHDEEKYDIGYNNNDYQQQQQHNYNRYSHSAQRNRYNRLRPSSSSHSTRYSRYNDNRSWDDRSQHSNDYDDTRSMANSSSMHSDDDQHSVKSKKMNENKLRSLNSLIDEYLASGVIDDILDFDCNDFRVWAAVINDGLRDRKSTEISNFIDLMVELFKHNILNNKSANFVNFVVKQLAIQLDDSSMDCPFITRYIGHLFVKLCYYQYLNIDDVYNYFIPKYREYSQYQQIAQKKTINKIIKYSIEELRELEESQELISKIEKYSI